MKAMEAPDILTWLHRTFVHESEPQEERDSAERGCRAIMAFTKMCAEHGTTVELPEIMRDPVEHGLQRNHVRLVGSRLARRCRADLRNVRLAVELASFQDGVVEELYQRLDTAIDWLQDARRMLG